MDNMNDIWEILSSFQEGFKLIVNRLDAQDQAITSCKEAAKEVEKILFNDIINPAKSMMEQADREDRFNDFSSEFGEKLGGYNDTLRALEGDDEFDLTKKAFEDLEGREDHPEAGDYVDALTTSLDEQLKMMRETLGVSSDATLEITQDGEDGETKVEVDGEDVTGEVATSEETIEESAAEPVEEESISEETKEDETSPEDEFFKQAEAALKKAGKLPGRK